MSISEKPQISPDIIKTQAQASLKPLTLQMTRDLQRTMQNQMEISL